VVRGEQATRERRGFEGWVTLLCISLAIGSAATCANAATPISSYGSGGALLSAPAGYIYQEHYLYDSASNPIGPVDANGLVYDLNNQQIGYIADGQFYDLNNQQLGYVIA